jgi:hypothetical protein
MNLKINIFSCILFLFALFSVKNSMGQTPNFDSNINIENTFYSDDTISPFSGQTTYGLGITADIDLYSDTAYIRVIVSNGSDLEYLIFESYTMLDTIWSFGISQEGFETSFFDAYQPENIIIQAKDASIHIYQINMATQYVSDASNLQKQTKRAKDLDIINRINTYLQNNDLIWEAGETYYSSLYYHQKKKTFGPEYQPIGFEYYIGGVFAPFYANTYIHYDPTYEIVQAFDWRNRHGVFDTLSPYHDGDTERMSGWMTEIKCQSGCWVNSQWECPDNVYFYNWVEYCEDTLGGEYRETNECAVFCCIGAIEGLLNIYYNEHLDYDLSEQQMWAVGDDCFENTGHVNNNLNYIVEHGLVNEECFGFEGLKLPCNLCAQGNDQKTYIQNQVTNYDPTLDTEVLKRDLIENGPQIWSCIFPGFDLHGMVLVGYSVIHEGDIIYNGGPIGAGHAAIGKTYWIFRNSHGFMNDFQNGYVYLRLTEDPAATHKIFEPSSWELDPQTDRNCRDEDGDGYFNWGIGSKPNDCCNGCPDEMDGNDFDASLGPIDVNGFLTIIDNYNMSFENGFCSWRQSGDDDVDLSIHSGQFINLSWAGPSGAHDGDKYLYFKGDGDGNQFNVGAYLESPYIDMEAECFYTLSFYYFISVAGDAADGRTMELQISTDDGQTWNTAWIAPQVDKDYWDEVSINLAPGTNRIRFFTKSSTFGNHSDMGIDYVSITKAEGASDLEITGNMYIDYEYHACGDIIIEPNSSLTLNCNSILYMKAGRKIIVKREGDLIIDGATITDAGDGMWGGIEVWGKNGEPGASDLHGWVKVKNQAIIENALCGIKTSRSPDGDGLVDGEYSGGVVQSNNSVFRNNKTAIEFYAFGPETSLNRISKTTFEVNDQLFAGVEVENLVKIVGIKGIHIKASTFQDLRTTVSIENKAIGIYSIDANYNLQAMCADNSSPCQNYIYNTFNNLSYGIKALGINSTNYFYINRALFTNTLKGVYVAGINDIFITYSDFETHPDASASLQSYGLYLEGCTGYTIEENDFHNDQPDQKGIGMVIYNSGSDPNEVYLNTFDNLEYAAIAQGYNAGNTTGLQFLCNHFNDCTMDIVVTGSSPIDGSPGIAPNQGWFSTNPYYMAGNVFFYNSIPEDFDDIYNEGRFITYYFANEAGAWYVEPKDANWDRVNKRDMPTIDPWDYILHCPPTPGGNTTKSSSQLIADIDYNKQKVDSIQTALNTLIDGGDTEGTVMDIDLSTPPESMDIYSELLGNAPYISDSAMNSAIEKEDVLPNAMIRDIMVASPQTAKSDELMDALDDRWTPMPDYMKADILQGTNILASIEESQSAYAFYENKRSKAFIELINHYREDSLNPVLSADSITQLLVDDNRLSSKYRLVFHYFDLGNIQAGTDLLNDIPFDFDLTSSQQSFQEDMEDYYIWMSTLLQNGRNIVELDSLQLTQLWDLYLDADYDISLYAQNMLLLQGEITHLEPIYYPDLMKTQQAIDIRNNIMNAMPPDFLRVFPNPSRDYVIIGYNHDRPGNAQISIVNSGGLPVHSFSVSKTTDQKVIDTRNWQSGTYIVSLVVNAEIIESVRFLIVH